MTNIYLIISIIVLLTSWEQQTNKKVVNQSVDTLYVKDRIEIIPIEQQYLDPIEVTWGLTSDQIIHYFSKSEKTDEIEAAKQIQKNYYPCSIVGKLSENGAESDFIINASGVDILTKSDDALLFYVAKDDVYKELFGHLEVFEFKQTEMLLLSQHRSCNCDECGKELCD